MQRLKLYTILLSMLLLGGSGLLWPYVSTVLTLVAEAALYLLLGFLFAGFLKVFLPEQKIYQHLGGNRFKSVLLASLFGIPLPLCSCSVLPITMAMRQNGASKGATTAFLISTPETGVDSIGITYALLDPIMTVARPVAAFMTALVTGAGVNALVRQGWDEQTVTVSEEACCDDYCHDHADPTPSTSGLRQKLRAAVAYAFGPLLDDLTPWFLLGFLLSGAIDLLLPDRFFQDAVPTGLASSLLMVALGIPMYICASAATPVAAMLIAKGLDPGAALVFLLVGPATNVATIIVVRNFLGNRILALYLVGIAGCALLLGAIVNNIYWLAGINLSATISAVVRSGISPVDALATAIFVALLCRSLRRLQLRKTKEQRETVL